MRIKMKSNIATSAYTASHFIPFATRGELTSFDLRIMYHISLGSYIPE